MSTNHAPTRAATPDFSRATPRAKDAAIAATSWYSMLWAARRLVMQPVATAAGANFMPFVIAVMVAASAGFITPIGYQTNLMVYGPGGYRFADFVRYGFPLSILCGIITLLIVPRVWPF